MTAKEKMLIAALEVAIAHADRQAGCYHSWVDIAKAAVEAGRANFAVGSSGWRSETIAALQTVLSRVKFYGGTTTDIRRELDYLRDGLDRMSETPLPKTPIEVRLNTSRASIDSLSQSVRYLAHQSKSSSRQSTLLLAARVIEDALLEDTKNDASTI